MDIELLEKVRGESAREYVLRVLRTNIINVNLKPGQNVSEKEIAEQLNVSRTPVREAIIRLSQEELLEVYPQKGTVVSLINMENVNEGRFVRITLEESVVKMACNEFWSENLVMELEENMNGQEFLFKVGNYTKLMHLDQEFHRIIFKNCRRDRTCSMIEGMNSDFNRIRVLRLKAVADIEDFISQHKEIMTAIKEKDAERAGKAMKIHLSSSKSDQELVIRDFPHFIK